ncbi:MAG: CvpA family protein [Thermotogae bacterium]|nr:CvpA family protein [Thermotogota bacterium]
MTWLIDGAVLLFVVFSVYHGLKRSKAGTEFWKLVALLLAIFGGITLAPTLAGGLTFLADGNVRLIIAFLIVFLLIHQGVQFIASALKLNFSLSGGLDGIVGGIFALIESSLYAGVLGYAASGVPSLNPAVKGTLLLSKLSAIAGSLITALGGKGLF